MAFALVMTAMTPAFAKQTWKPKRMPANLCTEDFVRGYLCEKAGSDTVLRKNSSFQDHGQNVCETETIANFSPNADACARVSEELNKQGK